MQCQIAETRIILTQLSGGDLKLLNNQLYLVPGIKCNFAVDRSWAIDLIVAGEEGGDEKWKQQLC